MQEAVEKSALGRVDLFQTLPQGERGAVNQPGRTTAGCGYISSKLDRGLECVSLALFLSCDPDGPNIVAVQLSALVADDVMFFVRWSNHAASLSAQLLVEPVPAGDIDRSSV